MLTTSFEWNGARFVVRPMSGMDRELRDSLITDVADVILKSRGYDWENIPRVLSVLIARFVEWAQVTTIEGDVFPACNLYMESPLAYFDAFANAVTTDQTLWSLWKKAYEDANRIDDSPLQETPDAQTVSA